MDEPVVSFLLRGIESPHAKGVAAAIFGGVVSKRFRLGMSFGAWVFAVCAGAGMAYILCVPIALQFGDINLAGVVGLMVGLFGLAICEKINDYIVKIDLVGITSELIQAVKSRISNNKAGE